MNTTTILILALAIAGEVVATTALKASDGFTRLWPSMLTILGYAIAFYCLSLTLKSVPLGIVYAIWSGVGIVAIAAIGRWLYGQTLDGPALVGIGLIVAGTLVINVWSSSVSH